MSTFEFLNRVVDRSAKTGGFVGASTAIAALWISAWSHLANRTPNPFAESSGQFLGRTALATPFAAAFGLMVGVAVAGLTGTVIAIGFTLAHRSQSPSATRVSVCAGLVTTLAVTALVVTGFGVPLPIIA